MRTALIIPALNEADVIGQLVARVPTTLVSEIIVVDNGSRDGTGQIAAGAGARVVREPVRGYGSACWAGVTALHPDTEIAAFLDGDGSQHPEEIARLLAPLIEGAADLVLGARQYSGNHPWHASLGTRAVAAFISWRCRIAIRDIGPYRAIRADLLHRLDLRDRAFGWPVEMVVKAALRRARIVEVPVSHSRRQGGRSKVSGTLVGSARASYAFIATAIRATRESG